MSLNFFLKKCNLFTHLITKKEKNDNDTIGILNLQNYTHQRLQSYPVLSPHDPLLLMLQEQLGESSEFNFSEKLSAGVEELFRKTVLSSSNVACLFGDSSIPNYPSSNCPYFPIFIINLKSHLPQIHPHIIIKQSRCSLTAS